MRKPIFVIPRWFLEGPWNAEAWIRGRLRNDVAAALAEKDYKSKAQCTKEEKGEG